MALNLSSIAWLPRVLPFALYMFFIFLQSIYEANITDNISASYVTPLFYAAKILLVFFALVYFRNKYDELEWKGIDIKSLLLSILLGTAVFILWINLDIDFARQGESKPYDPKVLPETLYYAFIIIRLTGASLIVPVFEEIFWRSFILRYIINPDFTSIKIGSFTWSSFIISSVLFGLEHNLWLAGIVAGVLYNILLYKTKNLYCCILSHGITNFMLGIYVLKTGSWNFW